MTEIILKHNGKNEVIQFPENWNELTTTQLLYIANLWESWQLMSRNNISLLKAKAMLCVVLMGAKGFFSIRKRLKLINQLTPEEQYDLIQLTHFIFEKNTLTKCPVPVIRSWFTNLYAPSDSLGNIKVIEFHFAERFYIEYSKSGKPEALDNLIGTLYRPKKDGSRLHFNINKIEDYADIAKKLSYQQRQAILLWYIGSRDNLMSRFAKVFSSGNQKQAANNGWLDIILELSGGKFGSFKETEQTELVLVLIELQHIKEKQPKEQQ